MGIQAHLVLPLPAFVTTKTEEERLPQSDPETGVQEEDYIIYSTMVTAPDGSSRWFNGSIHTSLWIDVNHWGSNRNNYIPWMTKWNIPFNES